MQKNANQLEDFETDELPSGGTLLYGQYTIERHLIDGGFGMTYLARDSLERRVVIKECFPSSICRRVGGEVRPRKAADQEQFQNVIRNFLREALLLAKFEHPNIVKVHQVFQENNTAYFAMDFVDGMDLLTILDEDPARLTSDLLETLVRDTLNALDHVHAYEMLHRDISPDNLLLDSANKLTLIDFGAAREDARRKTRVLSAVLSVKDGYSPHEFYYSDTPQDPASDLYSVGATFYHVITGSAPSDCQKRLAALSSHAPDPYKPLAAGNWNFSKPFLAAIDKALSVSQKNRFQSADEWLDALDAPETSDVALPVLELTTRIATDPDASVRELEPDVVEAIYSMVEHTNSQFKPANPSKPEDDADQTAAAEADDEPRRLVDLFGRPIEDVDAWLAEQDKLSAKDNAAELTDDAENRAGFTLGRALKSLVRKKRNPAEILET